MFFAGAKPGLRRRSSAPPRTRRRALCFGALADCFERCHVRDRQEPGRGRRGRAPARDVLGVRSGAGRARRRERAGSLRLSSSRTTPRATKALGLGGMQIGDRAIKVELARTPKRTPIGTAAQGLAPRPPPPGLPMFEGSLCRRRRRGGEAAAAAPRKRRRRRRRRRRGAARGGDFAQTENRRRRGRAGGARSLAVPVEVAVEVARSRSRE